MTDNAVLIEELAKFVCVTKHSGIDFWDDAAEVVKEHWRAEARVIVKWLRGQFNAARPDFGHPEPPHSLGRGQ